MVQDQVQPKDALGRDVFPGDEVAFVYPHSRGLRAGVVQSIGKTGHITCKYGPNQNQYTVRAPHCVVRVDHGESYAILGK